MSQDGSQFDSTQHAYNIDAVDCVFFKAYRSRLRDVLKKMDHIHGWKCDVEALTQRIVEYTCELSTVVFVPLKHIDNKNRRDAAQYKKFFPASQGSAAIFELKGTTFSGHPTRTTLGNTLRAIAYQHFIASANANLNGDIDDPN